VRSAPDTTTFGDYEENYAIVSEHPTERGIDWKSLPTLSDLVVGRVKGRQADQQMTRFINNIGMGAQFAAVGKKIYDAAKAKRVGREVPLDWFTQDVHP
jgi:alanine dehydrogenase